MKFSTKPMIESVQNAGVKAAERLRDRRGRKKSGEFLIDGLQEIQFAVRSGITFRTVYFVPGTSHSAEELQRLLAASAVNDSMSHSGEIVLQPVSMSVMKRLGYGDRVDIPVAVATVPDWHNLPSGLTNDSFVLVLDRTEKPGNLGAALRTASACGVDAVLLTDPQCDPFNPNTIRASRGSIFTVPIGILCSADARHQLQRIGLTTYQAVTQATNSMWDCHWSGGGAFVFGCESQGLSDDWAAESESNFTIPMTDGVESLNLSISVAVTLYEVARQRMAARKV